MISRVLAADLSRHVGGRVRIAGWVHRRRRLKTVTFLVIRDRSGLTQVVLAEPGGPPEETVVEVEGLVTANPQAPGGLELTEPAVGLLSEPAEPPPFALYRPSVAAALPTVLDNAAVALRHPRLKEVFAITAASVAGFRSALDGLGFTEIHTPKIVSSATESGANVFGIDYFGRRAFLAQYTSLDAELGFVGDHRDVMAVLREAIAGMAAAVPETGVEVPEAIPEIHFTEAQELVARLSDEDPRGEPDLAPAHERLLSDWALREHGSEFLFVTGYPMAKRPFYTHPDPARPGYSNSFDLLFRGLELVTGGQRLHRHADYVAALTARGESVEAYRDYLAVFAHGMPPHGGFALGLERWTARLLGLPNVRQATLFPRDLHRLTP
ncbi:amino acid--tRNA ligase-related protein [Amycolatopsis japonica]